MTSNKGCCGLTRNTSSRVVDTPGRAPPPRWDFEISLSGSSLERLFHRETPSHPLLSHLVLTALALFHTKPPWIVANQQIRAVHSIYFPSSPEIESNSNLSLLGACNDVIDLGDFSCPEFFNRQQSSSSFLPRYHFDETGCFISAFLWLNLCRSLLHELLEYYERITWKQLKNIVYVWWFLSGSFNLWNYFEKLFTVKLLLSNFYQLFQKQVSR